MKQKKKRTRLICTDWLHPHHVSSLFMNRKNVTPRDFRKLANSQRLTGSMPLTQRLVKQCLDDPPYFVCTLVSLTGYKTRGLRGSILASPSPPSSTHMKYGWRARWRLADFCSRLVCTERTGRYGEQTTHKGSNEWWLKENIENQPMIAFASPTFGVGLVVVKGRKKYIYSICLNYLIRSSLRNFTAEAKKNTICSFAAIQWDIYVPFA